GPLSLVEPGTAGATLFDYHLAAGSPAINGGGSTPANGRLSVDFDNDPRTPQSGQSDIGADEMVP
ncbi:MAG: choice-of-anchor Q domain-containing protein, partial [Candidatus Thiodiazotropha sp. 6PDIVS]